MKQSRVRKMNQEQLKKTIQRVPENCKELLKALQEQVVI